MKFSEQWLREWVNPNIGSQELMDQITMAGLEVDGFEAVAGEFPAWLWVRSFPLRPIRMPTSCGCVR